MYIHVYIYICICICFSMFIGTNAGGPRVSHASRAFPMGCEVDTIFCMLLQRVAAVTRESLCELLQCCCSVFKNVSTAHRLQDRTWTYCSCSIEKLSACDNLLLEYQMSLGLSLRNDSRAISPSTRCGRTLRCT